MCICMYIHIHVYICICVYIYIYIYIYICRYQLIAGVVVVQRVVPGGEQLDVVVLRVALHY